MNRGVTVYIKRLNDMDLHRAEMRDAHAVWCELLCDVRRAARDMLMLGHVSWAQWLAKTADFLDVKARLHLNRLAKDAREMRNERERAA